MRKLTILLSAAFGVCAAAAPAQTPPAQAAPAAKAADKATYITAEEIAQVEKAVPVGDRTLKVIGLAHENFAVGIVHRGKTVNGRSEQRQAGFVLPPSKKPCGRGIEKVPEGAYPGGITHDVQTEGYYITSGGGTMFTDGYIVNGTNYDLADLNGPTCLGVAHGVTIKAVKKGDVIVIPAGVVHGWVDIPDHVDYITFRPSPGVLEAGWVHPAIGK